jgi:hypothetical protein
MLKDTPPGTHRMRLDGAQSRSGCYEKEKNDIEDGGDIFLRNVGWLSTGVISQKVEHFIIIGVWTSNPVQR